MFRWPRKTCLPHQARELRERAWSVFAATLEAGGTVAFATHRNVIRAIVATALGISVGRSYALITDPGRGVLLRSEPRGWVLVNPIRWNDERPTEVDGRVGRS